MRFDRLLVNRYVLILIIFLSFLFYMKNDVLSIENNTYLDNTPYKNIHEIDI